MDENTINFERSNRFSSEPTWEIIDHDTLLRECTDEQITMMILYKATVRNTTYLYRKHIPEQIKDWAKITMTREEAIEFGSPPKSFVGVVEDVSKTSPKSFIPYVANIPESLLKKGD